MRDSTSRIISGGITIGYADRQKGFLSSKIRSGSAAGVASASVVVVVVVQ